MNKGRSILRSWLPMAFIITAMCAVVYLVVQQVLRQGANDPQIQMAEDAATILAAGGSAESVLPAGKIELTRSVAPFIVVFNESGNPIASSALLNGEMPILPAGVFDYVRQHGEDRITWQPQPGVRMATVVVNSNANGSGFVMAGRSLREVEKRVDQLSMETGILWLLTILGSLVVMGFSDIFLSPGRSNVQSSNLLK